jgi:hypothetical protein
LIWRNADQDGRAYTNPVDGASMEVQVITRPLMTVGLALALLVTGFAFFIPANPPRLANNPEASGLTRLTIQPMALTIPAGITTGVYDAN